MQLNSLIIIVASQVVLSVARTGFAKDENEDLVEFPPTILRTFDSSVPVGHLRPLGQSLYTMQPSLYVKVFIRCSVDDSFMYFQQCPA